MRLTSRQRAILELLAKAKAGRMVWHMLPGAGGHAYNMALRGLTDRGLILPWNSESVYVEISDAGRAAVAPPATGRASSSSISSTTSTRAAVTHDS